MSPADRPTDGPDLLGGPEPAPRPRGWRPLLAAAVGVTAVGVAGTGIALAVAFSGGGAQPEDVLPRDVVGLLKVDLDPAGGQKTAALQLAERFPSLGVDGDGDLRDDLLRRLFEDADVDYDRQVQPWIGDRIGVAALPASSPGEVEAVVVVQHDDREAAERLLPELVADSGEPAAFAFSERASYVVLATSQEVADRVAGTDEVLADDEQFAEDVDALDADVVALGWGDLGAYWSSLPAEARDVTALGLPGDVDPSGRAVLGVHLEDDAVELVGRSFGVELGDDALDAYALSDATGTGLLADLPEGAVAAVSLAGLGEQVGALVELVQQTAVVPGSTEPDPSAEEGVAALEEAFGIEVPEDLAALLGDELAVGVYDADGPQFAARTRGGDPERGLDVARSLLDGVAGGFGALGGLGDPAELEAVCLEQYDQLVAQGQLDPAVFPREEFCAFEDELATPEPVEPVELGEVGPVEDGVGYGSSAELLRRLSEGGLGDSPLFRAALPDVGDAGTVVFVDVQALLALVDESDEELAALGAFGLVVDGGADGSFTARLTVR